MPKKFDNISEKNDVIFDFPDLTELGSGITSDKN